MCSASSSSYSRVVQGGQHVTAANTTKISMTPTEQTSTTPIELIVHTGVQHVHMHAHTYLGIDTHMQVTQQAGVDLR